MRQDPFITLGTYRGATQREIYEAYKSLRNRYEEERFMEGEAGADAARKLQQLDLAYAEAIEYNHEKATIVGDSTAYDKLKQAISNKNLDSAQNLLDNITYRDAEWHYYQSIVYYERNWFAECKKQLQIALEKEPNNEKYKKSLQNLNAKLQNETTQQATNQQRQYEQSNQNYSGGGSNRSYGPNSSGMNTGGCCNVCSGLLCADCCCECMGGDLIRCC